jgi:DNA-binding MarR family transcriptional regulator
MTKPSSPSIGHLISEGYRLMARIFNARARDQGLTQSQWQAVAMLAKCEGVKQAELAEMLQMQPISLARLIDRMEASGWVERRPDPRDRRVQQLFLTAKVEPVLDLMHETAAQTRELAMAGMSEAEREQLVALLIRFTANLRRTTCAESNHSIAPGKESDDAETSQQPRRRNH